MTKDDLFEALGLPHPTHIRQRVPKKLLAEHSSATAADKRLIQDGVEEIVWLAALKPHLIGVPAYEDEQRQYVELAVLSLTLKAGAKIGRLIELVHRAVPYPVLLITIAADDGMSISLAHLRTSQNEADKTVLDGELLSVMLPLNEPAGVPMDTFIAALALACQPQADLRALYQGWLDTVDALDIARETGAFDRSLTREQAVERHQALQRCRQMKSRLTELRGRAQNERQLARQVALNLEIKQLLGGIEALQTTLNPGRL